MPRIFDNIDLHLLPALQETLNVASRADFCIGYFNLRGWNQLDSFVEKWSGGDENCCRLLVGMQRLPQEELSHALSLLQHDDELDNQTAVRLKNRLAEEFRQQLTLGFQTNADEICLRKLAAQIKAKRVVVKLFLRHSLHAKLYLLFRSDPINPIVGYLGSSNLTMAGLSKQGELNVDVLDGDACTKLAKWFEDRWNDRWCIGISSELVAVIEASWARSELIPPYHIYLKVAYHLSQEARTGLSEFRIPRDFGNRLFEFQTAAVKIAAHHLNKRGGVLIGDVVGLGKTLMATALARIFEDDHGLETLILCPKNLVKMWEDYRRQYRMRAEVLSVSQVIKTLPGLPRFRVVLIDESHNLRNREGKRFKAIQAYIEKNDSKVILLSATPYNKAYLDLGSQLRLFLSEEKNLGLRPEALLRVMGGEIEFNKQHQCGVRTLAAFEKSHFADDWRELMRLYLVRRTRTFIKDNYALVDCAQCGKPITATQNACLACSNQPGASDRRYLIFEDGSRSYFPDRTPKTVKFKIDESNSADQYAQLYSQPVVDLINSLDLPRYGLANYLAPTPRKPPTPTEATQMEDLSRAGKRLIGFCKTNLFKRLESSGYAFLLSVEHHVLRNHVFLHAIESGQPLPIGTQDAEMLDTRFADDDEDLTSALDDDAPARASDDDDAAPATSLASRSSDRKEADFERRAAEVYREYETKFKGRFKWLRAELFGPELEADLRSDNAMLFKLLNDAGEWDPDRDTKLAALEKLLTRKHPDDKVILFTQFADTVSYLTAQLKARGVARLAAVTGQSADPTVMAWRFSPVSNDKREVVTKNDELRVLLATDVLSEGQNLQDCHLVVNYDLPWAIIRLIQRAGRVDRIGQEAKEILAYSFLPADGVERIIKLRGRVRLRLRENAEVVGADEAFI